MARVTLRDVAEASGVSQSTASFVLNEVPNQTISPGTRERVQEAARSLGYVPHGIARALMEGSSRIVVLNIDRPHEGHYSDHFIRGLDAELALHGFVLLVRHGHTSASEVQQVSDVISPKAVIHFAGSYFGEHQLEDTGGGWKNGMAAHVLLQLRYLVDRGHSRIALAIPEGEPLGQVRLGFANEVAGMLDIPAIEAFQVPADADGSRAALEATRTSQPDVTAVAAFDDVTALRTLTAMADLGLTAPQDLAVIGFDETEYAAMFRPSLTTIRADAEGHGRLAARRALGLDEADIKVKLGRVVERESV